MATTPSSSSLAGSQQFQMLGGATTKLRSDPFPATGLIHAPIVGLPVIVSDNGAIILPLMGARSIEGLTLQQAAEVIRKAFTVDRKIIKPGEDGTIVTLIKPRVHRVVVIRDDLDSDAIPSYYSMGKFTYTKRGKSIVLDLPTRENDVMHALIASGGLPGIDAHNELWVMHGNRRDPDDRKGPVVTRDSMPQAIVRIPLLLTPGEGIPFTERDVILEEGDILHVRAREGEVFYTGGLLAGERVPLPRDRDLNVLEAIATATGTPGGYPGLLTPLFRNNGAGGSIKPTRVIVVRILPNREQVKISVDLNRAAKHADERLVIQANDLILLDYKPVEFIGNMALSLVHINITATNSESSANNATTTTNQGGGNNPEPPPDAGAGGTGTP